MHRDTTKEFASIAVEKIDYFKRNPTGYLISTTMAGAYVGVGIILILTPGIVSVSQQNAKGSDSRGC